MGWLVSFFVTECEFLNRYSTEFYLGWKRFIPWKDKSD